jgi:hypothetical protein
MNYPDFANVVVNGRKNINTAQESVMPSFGTNRTSCAISMTYSFISGRAPTTPCRTCRSDPRASAAGLRLENVCVRG